MIAVLPFANLSGDASQDYFSDGISEDVITELAEEEALMEAVGLEPAPQKAAAPAPGGAPDKAAPSPDKPPPAGDKPSTP